MNRPNYINILAKLMGMKSKVIISEGAMPSLQYKNGLQGYTNRFLIKSLYKKSDLVIANSKGNARDLINNFNIKKVNIVYNLCDIENILEQSKEKIEVTYNGFIFVTVGRLDSGKNHKLIIEAMQDTDAQLYIIGDGELKNNLKSTIENLGLQDKVFLLGRQKNPYKYLIKADCFVFASNHEGFPNVLIEALVCELPVISTDCQSGPRELLAPDNDVEVQLQNDIELAKYGILTPNNDLRTQYKKHSKQRSEDFDIEKIIQRYEKILCVE